MTETMQAQQSMGEEGADITIDQALEVVGQMMTPEQVAEKYDKSIHSVNWAIAHNKLNCRCILNRRQITVEDVEVWMKTCRRGRPRGPVPEVRPKQKPGRKPAVMRVAQTPISAALVS